MDPTFANWARVDNADRVVLVEIDYKYQYGGAPTAGTLRLANKFYVDDANGFRYREAISTVANFQRSLTGPTLGTYQSSIGTVEIDNANHEYDDVLRLALDNSEVRVYVGDRSWLRSDTRWRLMFSALAVRAAAPDAERISIQLKDASAFLDKSIGGEVLVGGSGPNAGEFRSANFGFVRQVPAKLVDSVTLTYSHSDRGDGTLCTQAYDRGIEVGFTDNGDGTFTLDAQPAGQVTADVLAVNPTSPPGDYTNRRVSAAFFQFIADRCGVDAMGRYAGAGATFTVGDDDDVPVGVSLSDATNVQSTFLPQLALTGNCFWSITHTGNFTFGRLQPNDVAALGLTPVNIYFDDIDLTTLKEDKLALPTYYRLQALINKNWYVATDVAAGVDPSTQAELRSAGLVIQQEEAIGETYADAPELYDRSLVKSPVIETWVSSGLDDDPVAIGTAWMERQRFLYLPWLQGISFTTGIEFYDLELGDVVNLTLPFYGCEVGVLFQVVSINIRPDHGKVDLVLLRRNPADTIPDGWTRVTEATDLKFYSGVPYKPPITPPAIPPFPLPILIQQPTLFFADNFTGAAGLLVFHTPDIGRKYVDDGAGVLYLDGLGYLLPYVGSVLGPPYVVVPVTPPGATYSIEVGFRLIATVSGKDASFEIILARASTNLVGVLLSYDGTQWHFRVTVYTVAGGLRLLYEPVWDAEMTVGYHTFRMSVTPSGTAFYFDAAVVKATTEFPDVLPNRLKFWNVAGTTGETSMNIDYINGVGCAWFVDDFTGSAPVIFDDTFTDTNGTTLADHVPEIGGGWQVLAGASQVDDATAATDTTIQSNAAVNAAGSYGLLVSTDSPASANYYVEGIVRFTNTGASNFNALVGARCGDIGSGNSGGYVLQLGYDSGFGWRMVIWDANSGATVASHTFSPDLNYDQDYTMRLEVDGTSLVGKLDGTTIVSATDSTYTAPGQAGFLVWTDVVAMKSVHSAYLNGGGTLEAHAPDIGGAYVASPVNSNAPLTDAVLDGLGFLSGTTALYTYVYPRSAAAISPGTSYGIEACFLVSAHDGSDPTLLDVAALDSASGKWLLHLNFKWESGDWRLYLYVYNALGTILFSDYVSVASVIGVTLLFRAETSPSGSKLKLNGVTKLTTAFTPDIAPDAIEFDVRTGGPSSVASVDYIKGTMDCTIELVVYWFEDEFAGSGDLSTHAPEVGGSYVSDGGSLSDMVLDGSGNLLLPSATSPYAQSVATPATDTWKLEWKFTIDSLASDGNLDVTCFDNVGNNWNLEPYLNWSGGEVYLTVYFVTSIRNSNLQQSVITAWLTTGIPHVFVAYVSTSGTIIWLDDVIVGALRGVPNSFNTVDFGIQGSGSLDYMRGVDGSTSPDTVAVAGTYFFRDTFTGAASALELHTPDSGHKYAHGAGHSIDGSGALLARTDFSTDRAVSYSGPMGTSYSFECGFTIGVATPTGRNISLEISLQDPDTSHHLVQWLLVFDTVIWTRNGSTESAASSGGPEFSDNDSLASIATGSHTLSASVTPSGTTFYWDGVSLWTTAEKPDVAPLAILIAFNADNTTDLTVDYVQATND